MLSSTRVEATRRYTVLQSLHGDRLAFSVFASKHWASARTDGGFQIYVWEKPPGRTNKSIKDKPPANSCWIEFDIMDRAKTHFPEDDASGHGVNDCAEINHCVRC